VYCDKPVYGRYAFYCDHHKGSAIRRVIREMEYIGIWSSKYQYSQIGELKKVLNRKRVSNDFKAYFKYNY